MPDEVRPQQTQGLPNGPVERPQNGPATGPLDVANHVPEEPAQGNLSIFDKRFALFMTQFGEACEQEGVEISMAVVADPKLPGKPLIFYHGQVYDVARLTREVLDHLRGMVMETLS